MEGRRMNQVPLYESISLLFFFSILESNHCLVLALISPFSVGSLIAGLALQENWEI